MSAATNSGKNADSSELCIRDVSLAAGILVLFLFCHAVSNKVVLTADQEYSAPSKIWAGKAWQLLCPNEWGILVLAPFAVSLWLSRDDEGKLHDCMICTGLCILCAYCTLHVEHSSMEDHWDKTFVCSDERSLTWSREIRLQGKDSARRQCNDNLRKICGIAESIYGEYWFSSYEKDEEGGTALCGIESSYAFAMWQVRRMRSLDGFFGAIFVLWHQILAILSEPVRMLDKLVQLCGSFLSVMKLGIGASAGAFAAYTVPAAVWALVSLVVLSVTVVPAYGMFVGSLVGADMRMARGIPPAFEGTMIGCMQLAVSIPICFFVCCILSSTCKGNRPGMIVVRTCVFVWGVLPLDEYVLCMAYPFANPLAYLFVELFVYTDAGQSRMAKLAEKWFPEGWKWIKEGSKDASERVRGAAKELWGLLQADDQPDGQMQLLLPSAAAGTSDQNLPNPNTASNKPDGRSAASDASGRTRVTGRNVGRSAASNGTRDVGGSAASAALNGTRDVGRSAASGRTRAAGGSAASAASGRTRAAGRSAASAVSSRTTDTGMNVQTNHLPAYTVIGVPPGTPRSEATCSVYGQFARALNTKRLNEQDNANAPDPKRRRVA